MALPQKSKTIILALLIVAQLVVIGALATGIYNQKRKVLGIVSVNPIKKEAIVYSPDSKADLSKRKANKFLPKTTKTLARYDPKIAITYSKGVFDNTGQSLEKIRTGKKSRFLSSCEEKKNNSQKNKDGKNFLILLNPALVRKYKISAYRKGQISRL